MPRQLLNIIFFILAGISINACAENKKAEPMIYLLPYGYVGTFFIITDIPTGSPVEYEGKSRVYRIPANGVLLTRFSFNRGWYKSTDVEFYFLNKDGSRTLIPHRWFGSLPDTTENKNDKEIYIFPGGTGTLGLGHRSADHHCKITFVKYAVATKPQVIKGIKEINLDEFFSRPPFPCQ